MKLIEELMELLVRGSGSVPIHNCILYLNNPTKNSNYKGAFGQMNASGGNIDHHYCFRIGSITKTFTATILLQLMEEDAINLDDSFLDCLSEDTRRFLKELMFVKGINYSNEITIKNLLQHRSGIRDYFTDNDKFFNYVMKFPSQKWEWKDIMEKYFEYNLNQKGAFPPGKGFHYSDTNYLLLAVFFVLLYVLSLFY